MEGLKYFQCDGGAGFGIGEGMVVVLQVVAAEDHLLGLKSIIYDQLTHKEKHVTQALPGFRLLSSENIRFSFTVEGEQVRQLLSMTPHVFRIGKAGAERLANTERLTDTASCVLNVYQRLPLGEAVAAL